MILVSKYSNWSNLGGQVQSTIEFIFSDLEGLQGALFLKLVIPVSRGPPGPLDPADDVVEDGSKVAPEDTVFP